MKGRQLLLLFLPLTSHVTTVIELIQSCLKLVVRLVKLFWVNGRQKFVMIF